MGKVVAVDIGTSGIRGKLLDPADGSTVRTCMTTRNPIPGANVMDHMSFAMEFGADLAHGILLSAVHDVVGRLGADGMDRLAVCGNPIQLSLFEGIDIRDLAFAGENKLRSEGIVPLDRSGHIVDGERLGFPGTEVLVPPAVKHEIGADALAMMLKSGFLEDDMCMVTDYGTNAEMALKVGDDIYTGSAAAGPAMEGQQIRCGMVAGPGALSDLVRTPEGWRSMVLDETLTAREGPMLNIRSDISRPGGLTPSGITGTGVVALVYAGIQDGRIEDARVRNEPIRIARRVSFDSGDLKEAGKAIGAIRAGHMTLMIKAGVDPEDIRTMYMAGATGTYVDPVKSKAVGLIIPDAERVVQVGNTSLELARDLALDPAMLDDLNSLRDRLVTEHTMFASSDVFRDLYLYEFGYWSDGMPLSRYRRALERYGMEGYLDRDSPTRVEKVCVRDIRDIGENLEIAELPTSMSAEWDCTGCGACVRGCAGKALDLDGGRFTIRTGDCLGTACMKCAESCPQGVFSYGRFKLDGRLPPHDGRRPGFPLIQGHRTSRRRMSSLYRMMALTGAMSTAYLVLLILLVLYVPLYVWTWRNPESAARYHLAKYGPCIMIKTRLGIGLMGRLGKHRRLWRAFGFFSKLTSAVLLFLMLYMVVVAMLSIPSTLGSRSIGIEYALAIPGFNPILPLSYGVVALVVAMVVHEMGHGIQSRANGIDVDSTGLLYGVVPLGAFVEPSEEQLKAAPRRPRMDVYTAGITVNTIVALIAFALLALACGSIGSQYEDQPGVYSIDEGSPALESGIPVTAIITGASSDGSETKSVHAEMWGNAASLAFDDPSLRFDPTVDYTLSYVHEGDKGVSKPLQMGAYVRSVVKGSPAETAGISYGSFVYSISIDGVEHKLGSARDYMELMRSTSPGQSAVVATVGAGEDRTVTYHDAVKLAAQNGVGFLGVAVNTAGLTLITPGALMDAAASPFANADGTPISYIRSLFSYLSGPMNGMSPLPDNVKWWYDAPLGEPTWWGLSLLYWIFWLDILLAISNALPAYPFDGGFIFAGWVDWLLEKVGCRDAAKREDLGGRISAAISNVVLMLFLMVLIAMLI